MVKQKLIDLFKKDQPDLYNSLSFNDINPEDNIYLFLKNTHCFIKNDNEEGNYGTSYKYYIVDGKKSADKINKIINKYFIDKDKIDFLEFACGHGCVTRHLVKNNRINLWSSDIHKSAMLYLKEKGIKTLQSVTNPLDFKSDINYDIVFALSFFSHMPKNTWFLWLEKLYSFVKPNGIIIFTTQGLKSNELYQGNIELDDDGFGFKNESEQKDLDTCDYGQTIVNKEFVVTQIKKLENVKLYNIELSDWWEHQDTYIIQKKKIL